MLQQCVFVLSQLNKENAYYFSLAYYATKDSEILGRTEVLSSDMMVSHVPFSMLSQLALYKFLHKSYPVAIQEYNNCRTVRFSHTLIIML